MFTAFTSYEVSLLIDALAAAGLHETFVPKSQDFSKLRMRLLNEQARIETAVELCTNGPITSGVTIEAPTAITLRPVNLKEDCEGLPTPPLFLDELAALPPLPPITSPIVVKESKESMPPAWEYSVGAYFQGKVGLSPQGGWSTMEGAREHADELSKQDGVLQVVITHHMLSTEVFASVEDDMPDTRQQCVIMKGNPVDGFVTIGPFYSREAAIEYGDSVDSDWWVLDMEAPEES